VAHGEAAVAEIERPIFAEGEILRAQELNTAIDQARLRDARHSRHQHRWGIVQGLNLRAAGGLLTIEPGVAIDFRGREILVPQARDISPQAFPFNGMAKEEDLYPVFLIATDEELTPDAFVGRCGGSTGQSKRDSYELLIQRYREAKDWEMPQEPLLVTEGPDSIPGQSDPPRVLLGFVKWDVVNERFSDNVVLDDILYPRRFAGPRGNVWESQAANVHVSLGPTPTGAQDVLSLHMFKAGKPQRLARVDQDGNLYIVGKLILEKSGQPTTPTDPTPPSTPTTGPSVLIKTGVANDGTKLPLPGTLTEDQIGNLGTFHLYTFVRPVATGGPQGSVVIECSVDENRVVHCLVRDVDEVTLPNTSHKLLVLKEPRASEVEYLVIANPKPKP
jgi:hypothetical protein